MMGRDDSWTFVKFVFLSCSIWMRPRRSAPNFFQSLSPCVLSCRCAPFSIKKTYCPLHPHVFVFARCLINSLQRPSIATQHRSHENPSKTRPGAASPSLRPSAEQAIAIFKDIHIQHHRTTSSRLRSNTRALAENQRQLHC